MISQECAIAKRRDSMFKDPNKGNSETEKVKGITFNHHLLTEKNDATANLKALVRGSRFFLVGKMTGKKTGKLGNPKSCLWPKIEN